MNILHCIKLDKDLEGLERAPYPGELGKKILENVSKDAWQTYSKLLLRATLKNKWKNTFSQKMIKTQFKATHQNNVLEICLFCLLLIY